MHCGSGGARSSRARLRGARSPASVGRGARSSAPGRAVAPFSFPLPCALALPHVWLGVGLWHRDRHRRRRHSARSGDRASEVDQGCWCCNGLRYRCTHFIPEIMNFVVNHVRKCCMDLLCHLMSVIFCARRLPTCARNMCINARTFPPESVWEHWVISSNSPRLFDRLTRIWGMLGN